MHPEFSPNINPKSAEEHPVPHKKKNQVFRVILLTLVAILLAFTIGFIVWASNAAGPMPEALNSLESDEFVHVTTNAWIVFDPKTIDAATGLIFYPGGRVDPRSYAPMARLIAIHGYKVVIVPMPLNLAVFGVSKADQVIAAFPEITHWVIGGHSLGGAMAANYAKSNVNLVSGLLLWAAYPASSDDLSTTSLAATSIYASLDGLATPEKIKASRNLLPPGTTNWLLIEGGNHAQFGWYGPQNGDNPATISREQQQAEIVEGSIDLLFLVSGEISQPIKTGFPIHNYLPV